MTDTIRSDAAKAAARTRKINAAKAKAAEALRALDDLSPRAAREVVSGLVSVQTARQEAAAIEYAGDHGAHDWGRAFWNLRGDVAGWLENVDRAVANAKFRIETQKKE